MRGQPTALPALLQQVLSDSCSDRHLLARFAEASDEAAFAAIVDRHCPMLLGVCRRLLGDAHLADDVVQATFLVLARKARSIRQRDSLAGWLYGVAHRIARQARLAECARSRRERRTALAHKEASASDPGWDELLRVLDEELHRLPQRYRVPLLLCYLEGRSQDEAAVQLGWSLSKLRRLLEGARQLLKARMVRRGATLGAALCSGFLASSASRAALTPELRRMVLTTALRGNSGGTVPPSILALANGGMPMATLTKIVLWSIVLITVGGVLAGVAWRPGTASEATEPSQVRPADPDDTVALAPVNESRPGRDFFNQPLPNGAVARLGSAAFRHGRTGFWWRSLAFTPDGKHLISTAGGWLRRWDLATGNALVNLGDGCRSGTVDADLLATTDGKVACVCRTVEEKPSGSSMECTEYNLETGVERRKYRHDVLQAHAHYGRYRILLPDGKTAADVNQNIVLWNIADGKLVQEFTLPQGRYTSMAFVPGGNLILGGDDTHTIHVLDRATGKELRSFGLANVNGVGMMAVSPDGKRLVTHSWADGAFRLWDVDKGKEERTLDFPDDHGVGSLIFTPDGRTIVAGIKVADKEDRAVVRSWDVVSGKPGRAWTDDPSIGFITAVSPDGKTLATMNDSGVIRLWDMATGKERRPQEASPCALAAVCFQPDGKTLLTVGDDRVLRRWDAATGRSIGPLDGQFTGEETRFSPGGMLLLSDKDKDVVRLLGPQTGKLLLKADGYRAILSPDSKRLATTAKDGSIRVIDVDSGKLLQNWPPPAAPEATDWPYPLARGFSADGLSLILQGEIVSVRDIDTGKQRASWGLRRNKVLQTTGRADPRGEERERIDCVVVSPDGSRIAFGVRKVSSNERAGFRGSQTRLSRLMVLETMTGKLLHQTEIPDETITQLAFSPDGKLLAACGTWTIRVWDVGTEKPAWQFEGHRGRVTSLAFSPDGKRLASSSEDSSVLIWDVAR